MNTKLEVKHAYVLKYGENEEFQAYLVAFDFMDDSIDNVKKWDEFFKSADANHPVKLIIELEEGISTYEH